MPQRFDYERTRELELWEVRLAIDYAIECVRGGLHYARATPSAPPARLGAVHDALRAELCSSAAADSARGGGGGWEGGGAAGAANSTSPPPAAS